MVKCAKPFLICIFHGYQQEASSFFESSYHLSFYGPTALVDSSDGSADELVAPSLPARLSLPVGKCRSIPSFTGKCLGDQVHGEGSAVTRVASVQAGGTGRDRCVCRHWGQSGISWELTLV